MSRPLARYTPCRRFLSLTLVAFLGAVFSAGMGLRWTPSWIAAGLFLVSAVLLAAITIRPAIEIHETHLRIGKHEIPWGEIMRVDQTNWNSPLAVRLTLADNERLLLLYPGDTDSCNSLLRHLRRSARRASLDGVPYRQFWGEAPISAKKVTTETEPPKYQLLRPEDEEEVERLFQKLKSVGRMDSRGSDDK